MKLLGYLSPFWFFASFSFGLIACYVIAPKPTIVVKFPSPFNAGKIHYRDDSDNCFVFNSSKVACPSDPSLVKKQPLMVHMES